MIRIAQDGDASLLAALGAETFRASCVPETPCEDVEAFVAEYYTEACTLADIRDAKKTKFIAEIGGESVGFATWCDRPAPPCVVGPRPVSLQTIGVLKEHWGAGVAGRLLAAVIDKSAREGFETIWLGVEERNARAIAFYAKNGFVDVGSRVFPVGREQQVDRIMVREVRI